MGPSAGKSHRAIPVLMVRRWLERADAATARNPHQRKLRSCGRKWKPGLWLKTQPAPEGAGCPLPPCTPAQELVLSTVTARRFCDQHEMSLHTATGRSLPYEIVRMRWAWTPRDAR